MSKMSREKGKRGERLWRDLVRSVGGFVEAVRAGYKQAAFGGGGADVEDDSGFWWEVKFVEALNVRRAYEQAAAAAPLDKTPAVAHKTSRSIWLVTLAGEDFLRILRRLREVERLLAEAKGSTLGAPSDPTN
jgi:hypothetical protein